MRSASSNLIPTRDENSVVDETTGHMMLRDWPRRIMAFNDCGRSLRDRQRPLPPRIRRHDVSASFIGSGSGLSISTMFVALEKDHALKWYSDVSVTGVPSAGTRTAANRRHIGQAALPHSMVFVPSAATRTQYAFRWMFGI